ncbi:DNA topoisomerase III, partial [Giardia duodenalis]
STVAKHLKNIGGRATQLILCLDNDREGENICFEVLKILKPILRSDCRVRRARFSAVTKTEIHKAFCNLDKPDQNLSDAVEARQELDLKIGVAFTRFQTAHLHAQFADLQSSVISYGPCQTPTLSFCVSRHDEIQRFRPKQIFSLNVCALIDNQPCSIKWQGTPSESRDAIEEKRLGLFGEKASKRLKVLHFKSNKSTLPRPLPMNTVALLKAASTVLGFSPNSAMAVAERLYISGHISYPRTESTAYPNGYNLREVVNALKGSSSTKISQCAQSLLPSSKDSSDGKDRYTNPRKGADQGDHPPIMPTGLIPHGIGGDELSLYNLVAKHFLATVSPDAVYNHSSLSLQSVDLPSETFLFSVTDVLDHGWRALYNTTEFTSMQDNDLSDDPVDEGLTLSKEALQAISVAGAQLTIASADIKVGMTRPPKHLSESDLLGLMEKHGIGTDASMATHIGNIVTRAYVELRVMGRRRCLVPTSMGVSLIHGYQLIDEDLSSPQLRASIERDVTRIAEGKIRKEALVSQVLAKFLAKFLNFKQNIGKLEALLNAKFTSIKKAGRPFILCGECHRYTDLIEQYPPRVYCATCDKLYTIPVRGKLIEIPSRRCPYDGWPLILHVAEGTQRRSFFCLHCYTFGLNSDGALKHLQKLAADNSCSIDIEQTKSITCGMCLNSACQMSLIRNQIGACWHCNAGGRTMLTLDDDELSFSSEPVNDTPAAQAQVPEQSVESASTLAQPKKILITIKPKVRITFTAPQAGNPSANASSASKQEKVGSLAELVGGYLYLDAGTARRHPGIYCNRCNFQIAFQECKASTSLSVCTCGRTKLRATDFADKKSVSGEVAGCVHCDDDLFQAVAEYKDSSGRQPRRTTQPRGHGPKNRMHR